MQEIAKSSVVYPLTMEDLITHQLFLYRHSPTLQRMQRRNLIISSLTVLICALGAPFLAGSIHFWPSVGAGFAGVAYILYFQKHGYSKRVRKIVQQMYSENKHPGLLGEHTLEVDETGITHTSAYSRTHYAWGALQRIETESGYTYLYLGELAFIIRHDGIISGDFKAFLEKIGRHHQPDQALAC